MSPSDDELRPAPSQPDRQTYRQQGGVRALTGEAPGGGVPGTLPSDQAPLLQTRQ
jgi:hypothetical protein